ncbi:MAG: choice-of-anchor W domain-containing protein [Planctomycetota bacterium]
MMKSELAVIAVLAPAGLVFAQVGSVTLDSDAAFLALGADELFVAEARNVTSKTSKINADWELGLGPTTQQAGAFDQKNTVWVDEAEYDFTLTVGAGGALDWEIVGGGSTITLSDSADVTDLGSVFIRVAGLNDENTASLFDLNLDGTAITDTVIGQSGGANYIVLFGADIEDGFTLTGTFQWDFGENNPGSRPSIQIKGATGNPIPTPGALALAALAGGLGIRRKR